ncbi:GTPase-activating protein skywalker-like [Ornithodoros turicata]|uniref:GTPase-activating protein skywalker-like n=1 Tax=Ornithodoros turicata TaxID=34597 RepID=UPI0031399376
MSLPSCFEADYVDAAKLPHPVPRPPTTVDKTFDDVMKLLHAGKDKEAKQIVRTQHWPLDYPRRGELWTSLSMYHARSSPGDLDYASLVSDTLGSLGWPSSIPAFTDPIYCEDYLLNAEGQRRVERLVYVISTSHPFITYCPLLHPLATLFLHYVAEDRTYDCLCALIEGTTVRHLSQTQLMYDTSAYALMQLTKRLCGKTYGCLLAKVGKEDELEKIFRTWLLWIFRGLPFYHLVRAVDCFLLEGVRAFYRVAMAILSLFIQDHANEFHRDSMLARLMPGRRRARAQTDPGVVLERIVLYTRNMHADVDHLLKAAYGIQGFSAQVLNKHLMKAETFVRSRATPCRSRSSSTIGLPEQRSWPAVRFLQGPKQERYNKLRTLSLGILPVADFTSDVLEQEHIVFLWTWLPPRISILQPQLIYSTNEHGSSLTNFYALVETWEPTVLAIFTTEGEVIQRMHIVRSSERHIMLTCISRQRFGAYCSTAWQERKQTYFGTGETFLFTFAPEARCFPWVGAASATDVPHTSKLFLSGNQNRIQVGAGNGLGLYVDGDLTNGRTEHCDTFDNYPLAPGGDFVIRVLEVFGFS